MILSSFLIKEETCKSISFTPYKCLEILLQEIFIENVKYLIIEMTCCFKLQVFQVIFSNFTYCMFLRILKNMSF